MHRYSPGSVVPRVGHYQPLRLHGRRGPGRARGPEVPSHHRLVLRIHIRVHILHRGVSASAALLAVRGQERLPSVRTPGPVSLSPLLAILLMHGDDE